MRRLLWAAAGGVAALALAGPAEASDHPPDPAAHAAPALDTATGVSEAEAERQALQAEKQQARELRKAEREQRQAELRERHQQWWAEQQALHQQWQDDLERRWDEYLERVRCACQVIPPAEVQPGTQPGPQPDQPVEQPAPTEQPKPVEPGKPSGSQPDKPKPAPAPDPAPVDGIGWRDWDEWTEDVDQRWQQRNEATRAMWEAVPESDTPVLAALGATVATVVQYPVVAIVDTVTDLGRPVVQGLDAGLSPVTGGLRPVLQGLRCATAWLAVPLEPLLRDTVRVVEGTELLPGTLDPVLAVVVDPRSADGGQPAPPTPGAPAIPAAPADGGNSEGQPAPHKPTPADDSTHPQAAHTPAGDGASLDTDTSSGADRGNQPGPGQPGTPANSGTNGGGSGGASGVDGVTSGLADTALTAGARLHPADTTAASHTCPPPTRPA